MSARARLAVAFVSTGVVFYIALGSLLHRVMGDTSYGQLMLFNEVVRVVMESYVDPVDLDRTLDGAYRGLTEALDGDSGFLDPAALQALDGAPAGDADVGLVLTRRFGFLMVVAARPGSPAAAAGVRTGDVVKTIDGRHSRQLAVAVGERLLRGEPGSSVALTLLRASSDPIDVTLTRERLVPAALDSRILGDDVAYLRVPEFAAGTAEAVHAALDGFERRGARAVVLDLRGTAYGPIEEGIRVAQLFRREGVVARLQGRRTDETTWNADPARVVWQQPVAVLTSRGTAGAAEVLVAALHDADVPVVGTPTFGSAGIQKRFPLPEGALVLTVARYVSPKGEPIHGAGVAPTELVAERAPEAEGAPDPALDKALELMRASSRRKAA
jgi:carboxyl-terminal processing protease